MKNLKIIRKNNNMTMRELGNILQVSESTISLYEKGKRQPNFDILKKLANFFNVSIDYLLERKEIKENSLPPIKKKLLDYYDSCNEKSQEMILWYAKCIAEKDKDK